MFIVGIATSFGILVAIIASIVFFSQPSESEVESQVVFNKPKVNINFDLLDADEFKNLQEFQEMETRFSYEAKKDGQEYSGFITAPSIEEAMARLKEMGYEVDKLEESEVGRENPFESYDTVSASELQNILKEQ